MPRAVRGGNGTRASPDFDTSLPAYRDPTPWATDTDHRFATSINTHGSIVGFIGSGPVEAVPWSSRDRVAVKLGRLRGGDVSRAYDINDRGFVVGKANTLIDPSRHIEPATVDSERL